MKLKSYQLVLFQSNLNNLLFSSAASSKLICIQKIKFILTPSLRIISLRIETDTNYKQKNFLRTAKQAIAGENSASPAKLNHFAG